MDEISRMYEKFESLQKVNARLESELADQESLISALRFCCQEQATFIAKLLSSEK